MAQRRMSRKSFRKSKGRKTRSMRKRTMGGAVDVKETVERAFTEFEKTGDPQNAIIKPLTATGMFSGITGCGSDKACQIEKANKYALAAEIVSDDMKTIIEDKLQKHATEAYLNLAALKTAAEEKVLPVRKKFEDEKAAAARKIADSVAASEALAAKSKAQEELDATERIYDFYQRSIQTHNGKALGRDQIKLLDRYYETIEEFCKATGHEMRGIGDQKVCNMIRNGAGGSGLPYTLENRLTRITNFKQLPDIGLKMSDKEGHLSHYIDKIDEKNPLSKITFYIHKDEKKTTLPLYIYMPSSEEVEQYKSELQEVINSASGGRKTRRRRNKKSRKTRRR